MKDLEVRRAESLARVRKVVRAAASAGLAQAPVLETRHVEAIRGALDRDAGFDFELYERLALVVRLAGERLVIRAEERASFGDVLRAIDALVAAAETPWDASSRDARDSGEPVVGASLAAMMEVRAGSAGLLEMHRRHREGAVDHRERSKRFIRAAAARAQRHHGSADGVAVLLGVGPGHDVPLVALSEHFARLVLVDIDREALEETRSRLPTEVAAKLTLRALDVTDVGQHLLDATRDRLATAADEAAADAALAALFRSYSRAGFPRFGHAADEPCDFVVSGMLLSQLGDGLRRVVRATYLERFGREPAARGSLRQLAFAELVHRVQQDHVEALLALAPAAVLISDLAEAIVERGVRGELVPIGPERPFLATPTLDARLPAASLIDARDAWTWRRIVPARAGDQGSMVRVEALALARTD